MASTSNPEIGQSLQLGDVTTNVHDQGSGSPVLLIHGSGPGVTALANWRLVMPRFAEHHRVVAPDMIGFGYTEASDLKFDLSRWVRQCVDLLDALEIERTAVVGNSFGGAVGLRFAIDHPDRVNHLTLMGASATPFPLTEGLDQVWGYEPSIELMSHLVRDVFVYDSSAITDDLVELRYQASIRPGFQERFAALFPAPRQRWIDAMSPSRGRVAGARHTHPAGPRPRRQSHPSRQLPQPGRADTERDPGHRPRMRPLGADREDRPLLRTGPRRAARPLTLNRIRSYMLMADNSWLAIHPLQDGIELGSARLIRLMEGSQWLQQQLAIGRGSVAQRCFRD